ncbi:MAG TPA: preprotein translocase subunit SecA [Clostridiaceae bacterium]|jgi:preprotein translocase subunit SecA|nr:preprotein translocase subunit SecA [Clostridiaceae bacterium]
MGLFEKLFGTSSERAVKQIMPIVKAVNELEPRMEKLSDEELRSLTAKYKERFANGESLDDLLVEAFATVREAAKRVLGQRHYDVQIIGGVVLHQGRIAEMKTGEGKTLVSTLPAYLNALTGNGVHIVTVNDYLAKRDRDWMGKIYNFLGLSVGCIIHGLTQKERQDAYNCDITYATNNELGFDYLRDNMVIYKEQLVQRELNYAIIDEVDSILIDEARTPLIIAGSSEKPSDMYEIANTFVRTLSKKVIKETDSKDLNEDVTEDYIVDEKARTATLTPYGVKKAESFFNLENLADPENATVVHHINQALKAYGIMKRDIDYVVKDGSVLIVDEFTGRIMMGRRFNEGLHQAIEAKEGVQIEKESMTQATITFQNFFRMYKKLSGMTGTAMTEEAEFKDIYALDVVEIPTNKPIVRQDLPDAVYKTENGKFQAVIKQVEECHRRGQPVLIGTISIEKSEYLSKLLKKRGVPHNVLNAKHHEREAEIVAQAGKFGAVTIATNMAGRGTDIMLGGNSDYMAKQKMRKEGYDEELILQADSYAETTDERFLEARKVFRELVKKYSEEIAEERKKVLEAGGLFIIGTERHESRRIDNQLRGRSGRQGDPGMSKFYISLEDDLMRLFGSDRLTGIVDTLGLPEDQPIEHKMLSNAIETAQKRVEGRNFEIRKHVLQYDDVMNKQREIIYSQRRRVLDGENLREQFIQMIRSRITETAELFCHAEVDKSDWNYDGLKEELVGIIPSHVIDKVEHDNEIRKAKDVIEYFVNIAVGRYEEREREITPEIMREVERVILLRTVDEHWMTHIDAIDQLKHGVGLRAYGNRDPVVEYKFESFEMFEQMNRNIQSETLRRIFTVRVSKDQGLERQRVGTIRQEMRADSAQQTPSAPVRKGAKIGRNEPCPCGSGKKYKNCCGRQEA